MILRNKYSIVLLSLIFLLYFQLLIGQLFGLNILYHMESFIVDVDTNENGDLDCINDCCNGGDNVVDKTLDIYESIMIVSIV
ncbi:hypothetical protein DERP_014413 [Dermatophagoides pteronyssinus]|uniref:Secreted protein n=1 Tax=Dermatophagoides pteronyssinus TaxID=6956 RepID=A0ABQ8J5V0_DERPT|nr:hypothetical protein DERP_014413 [Dermatophagoides pteronyssinus]